MRDAMAKWPAPRGAAGSMGSMTLLVRVQAFASSERRVLKLVMNRDGSRLGGKSPIFFQPVAVASLDVPRGDLAGALVQAGKRRFVRYPPAH